MRSAALATVFVAVSLQGCSQPSISGSTTTTPTTTTTTTTTTGTTLPRATNIWQWRSDMDMGTQQTYDLSGDIEDHGLYGGCWDSHHPVTLAGGWEAAYEP